MSAFLRGQAMARWSAANREEFEHLAAKYQFDAPDVYPTQEAAEREAFEDVVRERRERAEAEIR